MRISNKRFNEAVKDTGGILTLVSKRLNISRQSLYNFLKKNPEKRKVLKQEREKIIDLGEGSLFNQVKNQEAWAVKFLLKTVGKERGYYEKQEVESYNPYEEERERIRKIVKEMKDAT